MQNREKFIELIYKCKNSETDINWLRYEGFISFEQCRQRTKQALLQILYESGNNNLDNTELSICLLVAMLIVNTGYAKSDILFENQFGTFCRRNYANESKGNLFLHYHDFRNSGCIKHFYYLAKEVVEQEGACNMTQLLSDILDWKADESIEERWVHALTIANSKKYIEANGYCAYNKNPDDRDCHSCSLSNYGNDCHNKPIK